MALLMTLLTLLDWRLQCALVLSSSSVMLPSVSTSFDCCQDSTDFCFARITADGLGFSRLSEFAPYLPGQCPACNFTPQNSLGSNSTDRDAVIASMLRTKVNIVPFVRSLRTTGCRARIVFIADQVAVESCDAPMRAFLDNCGVTLINIGHVNCTERFEFLMFRNHFLASFLLHRTPLFDRIVIADLFDTVFQGDPFSSHFDRTSLGFALESDACDIRQQLSAIALNKGWNSSRNTPFPCINGGTMIGVESAIFEFLRQWANYAGQISRERLANISFIPDQVITNVIIRMGLLSNLTIRFYHAFEEYSSLWDWYGTKNATWWLGEFRLWKDGPFPMIVHMYDRSGGFCKSVNELCPPLFPVTDQYVRC
jgi:hypothetical protein